MCIRDSHRDADTLEVLNSLGYFLRECWSCRAPVHDHLLCPRCQAVAESLGDDTGAAAVEATPAPTSTRPVAYAELAAASDDDLKFLGRQAAYLTR
eukprot:62118-Alexandrium_andersonii.AAC.1